MGLERSPRCHSVCGRRSEAGPPTPKSHHTDICLLLKQMSFSGSLKWWLYIRIGSRNLFLTVRVVKQGHSWLENLPDGKFSTVGETNISQEWWGQQRLRLPWGKELDWMSLSKQKTEIVWVCVTSPISSSQHSQCHIPASTSFPQVASHHPDHLCCLSPRFLPMKWWHLQDSMLLPLAVIAETWGKRMLVCCVTSTSENS